MKKNLDAKKKYKEIEDFFAAPPDTEEKAWHIIHMFYHNILTIMDKRNVRQTDIARKLGKSKSAVSKMLNNTPNISVLKMVELADAVGAHITIHVHKQSNETRTVDAVLKTTKITENEPQKFIEATTNISGSFQKVASGYSNVISFSNEEESSNVIYDECIGI